MPNRETEGALVGFYADVDGTQTLVAARRSFELEETSESIDITHADNMVAPIQVSAINSADIVLQGDRRLELNAHPEFEIINSDADDGTYEADSTSYDSNNDETTVTLAGSTSGGAVGDARALIVAPYGFMNRTPGQQDWTASLDAVMLLDDATGSFEASHQALRDAKRNQNDILTQVRYPNTDGSNPRDEARASVISVTLTAPYDAEATVALELEGAEPLVKQT